MIVRCQGVSPDGAYGCTRPMGHDERGQPCKNLSTGVLWCALCDSYEGCDHLDKDEAMAAKSAADFARAARWA